MTLLIKFSKIVKIWEFQRDFWLKVSWFEIFPECCRRMRFLVLQDPTRHGFLHLQKSTCRFLKTHTVYRSFHWSQAPLHKNWYFNRKISIHTCKFYQKSLWLCKLLFMKHFHFSNLCVLQNKLLEPLPGKIMKCTYCGFFCYLSIKNGWPQGKSTSGMF